MKSHGFEVLDHTADIGIRVRGSSIVNLFENAALGMLSLWFGELPNAPAEEETSLEVSAMDHEQLLVRFLNELVYLVDFKKILPLQFAIRVENGISLLASVKGIDLRKLELVPLTYVKAATYHQLKIKEESDGFTAEIYFDV
ncbi:MAG: archease [Bacteroidetes bacterium]|nr:archease [Bacteroidota bacterium]